MLAERTLRAPSRSLLAHGAKVVDAQNAALAQPGRGSTRVLASLLFTDIVGSTDRVLAVGDLAWRALLDEHDAVVSGVVRQWRGRIVKTTGDGILATFEHPSAAIEAARVIQQDLARIGVQIRAGVHTGEVELRGNDVGGIAVHIGARITALAGADEVLVSRTVRDLVIGSGIMLANRGFHVLKGLLEEWQLYAVDS